MQFFADSGFANEAYIITMIKGYVTLAGLTFNALMARIRILIENAFAGQHQMFVTAKRALPLRVEVRSWSSTSANH